MHRWMHVLAGNAYCTSNLCFNHLPDKEMNLKLKPYASKNTSTIFGVKEDSFWGQVICLSICAVIGLGLGVILMVGLAN